MNDLQEFQGQSTSLWTVRNVITHAHFDLPLTVITLGEPTSIGRTFLVIGEAELSKFLHDHDVPCCTSEALPLGSRKPGMFRSRILAYRQFDFAALSFHV